MAFLCCLNRPRTKDGHIGHISRIHSAASLAIAAQQELSNNPKIVLQHHCSSSILESNALQQYVDITMYHGCSGALDGVEKSSSQKQQQEKSPLMDTLEIAPQQQDDGKGAVTLSLFDLPQPCHHADDEAADENARGVSATQVTTQVSSFFKTTTTADDLSVIKTIHHLGQSENEDGLMSSQFSACRASSAEAALNTVSKFWKVLPTC